MGAKTKATRDLLRDIHGLTEEELAQAMDRWAHLSELVVPRRRGETTGPEPRRRADPAERKGASARAPADDGARAAPARRG